VAHVLLVHVLQRAQDFVRHVLRHLLGEHAELDDAVEQLAARHELHHKVDVVSRLKGIEAQHDVRVPDRLEDLGLRLHQLHLRHRIRLLDDFHCCLLLV